MEQTLEKPSSMAAADGYEETDIFLWANNLVQIKEELEIELFFFNKNNVVYKTSRSRDLELALHQLLIDPVLEYVLEGADRGLQVRNFEEAESEENVLQRVRVGQVGKAAEVLNWLKSQEHEIEMFVEDEHDMKRLKGIVARVTHRSFKLPAYVIKALPAGNLMKGSAGWLMRNGRLVRFDAEGALRIPPENHLLILENDMYVFSQVKLESLFGYNAKKNSIAEKRAAEIETNFHLSFLEGQTLNTMIRDKRPLINKLQKLDPRGMTQAELLNHAEELGIELLTDNDGAIIIMDGKDLSRFINLLNDDYMESALTGLRYEIRSKKPLQTTDEDTMRSAL